MLTNYAIGAKLAALDAQTQARPDQTASTQFPLRRGKILADDGTATVQLLDDAGQPVKDAAGNNVVLTRVPRFPAADDDSICALWCDASGITYILNTGGSGGASEGTLQGWRDLGWASTRE